MPARRRFTAEYKLKILQEAARCTQPGEVKALLDREGLYSSYLTAWRRQQENGALSRPADSEHPSPPPPSPTSTPGVPSEILLEENRRLQQANERLHARLRQAEVTIEVQKKVAEIVGVLLKSIDYEEVDA